MPTPSNKYDREQQRRIAAIQKQIDAIYDEAVKEAAALGVTIDMPKDAEKPFSFDDYPLTERRVKELLDNLRKSLHVAIVNAVRSSWTLSNNKNNELCNVVFGNKVGKLTQQQYRRYYSNNADALEAFLQRKERGLNLSDRVWRYTDLFKREIEMGIDLGIRDGLDAAAMARDLKQYLRHPDKLFRRVRDEHGILHLSRNAAAFHPGQGVYRSSYMNARRLAATETNIAYRTADHERWKKMDFVVGIEVHLSHNHTCLGRDGKPHKFTDICDHLKGRYPKDFKFTGWHPHCRCFTTSILKTDKELDEDRERILRGESPTTTSKNTVEDVPKGFSQWIEDNQERINRASERGTLPYFLRDNGSVEEGKFTLRPMRTPTPPPTAAPVVETPTADVSGGATTAQPQPKAIETPSEPFPEFHKCKTVEEYGQLISTLPFIQDVDLEGCTLAAAEKLTRRLFELHSAFLTPTEAGGLQFATWVEKAKGEGSRGHLGEFDMWGKQKLSVASNAQAIIDRNISKQKREKLKREKAQIAQMEANIQATERDIEEHSWMGDDPWLAQRKEVLVRMKEYHAELVATLDEKMKGFVPERETTSMTIEDVLNHEFGHYINDNLRRNWRLYPEEVHKAVIAIEEAYGYTPEKPNYIWEYGEHFLDSVAFDEGRKISFYASTEGSEYFAEAFAYYCQTGTTLNPLLDNLFNALKRNER